MIPRRTFLKLTAASVAAAGVGVAAQIAPQRVRLTRHRISGHGLQLRIAHLTDLHVGWATPQHILDEAVALCRRARPDLVVLTGDYLNRSLKHLPALSRLVARLPRPCVATLGNHDYWSGAAEIQAALEAREVMVLRNTHKRLRLGRQELSIVGVDDGYTDHADVETSFAGLENPKRALVLTHDPNTAGAIAERGGRLILAGHTHGGQIQIHRVTDAIARVAGNGYLAGWYSVADAKLYVNSGLGSSAVRLRVGERARPEVALFDFVS